MRRGPRPFKTPNFLPSREKVAREAGRMRGFSELPAHRRFNGSGDCGKHQFRSALELGVGEAQYAEALALQPSIPSGIALRIVERPIRLDDQPMPQAYEVRDVPADRNLAPELQPAEPSVAQDVP